MSSGQAPTPVGGTPPATSAGGTGPAEQPPATGPDKPPDPPAGGSLREQVAAVIGDLLGTGKARVGVGTAPPAERDIAAEVRREVEGLHNKQERDSLLAGLKTDVETLKQAGQKPPEQVRRVERVMGWRRGDS